MRVDRLLPAGSALCAVLLPFLHAPAFSSEAQWVNYPGGEGPGAGRKVVLIAGDEEYRSESERCRCWASCSPCGTVSSASCCSR